jgi:hypothetical protein
MLSRAMAVGVLGLCIAVPAPVANGAAPSCAVVGDSIALGIGAELPACRRNARIGIPSDEVIARVDGAAAINIVSAGSNDPLNPMLPDNLERIRDRAKRVVWILPIHATARAAVRAVAVAHGDPVVSFAPSDDHVHPRSYAELAQAVAAALP